MNVENQDLGLSLELLTTKRTRASKPKVRTGCFTCKARRVKCDEAKPACARCTRTGRQCDGYWSRSSTSLWPRALAPAPAVDSPLEPRALEFFFIKTAPQLAGFFAGNFFQGSVLQLSLAEPAIRQAIAAIGVLHERAAMGTAVTRDQSNNVHLQLYNRAIRAVLEKAKTAGPRAFPLLAMTNVLFTCLEIFQGNVTAASVHIQSGINLVQAWREENGKPRNPWGRKYKTFESRFMETEIAPILSLFNTNAIECGGGKRTKFLMNPLDEHGSLLLADRFETLIEARVGLIDMITDATSRCVRSNENLMHRPSADIDVFMVSQNVQRNLEQWQNNVDDLCRREYVTWNKTEQQVANVIKIIKLSTTFGIRSYQVTTESEWDPHRSEYEEIIRRIKVVISDTARFPDDLSRTLSLDCGMIFPLHAAAWKCRWPKVRRQGLDLLLRVPKREWLFEAQHYHTIFHRIMELEEEHLNLPSGAAPDENWLPPEHVRIRDFIVTADLVSPEEPPTYNVTFISNPQGPQGPLKWFTEPIRLPSSQPQKAAIPTNMIGRKLEWPALSSLSTQALNRCPCTR